MFQRVRINFLWRLRSENWQAKPGRSRRIAFRRSSLIIRSMVAGGGRWLIKTEVYRHGFAAAKLYFADMRVSEKIWRMFEETPPEGMYIVTPSDMAESDITFVPASKADALSVAPGGPQFAAAGNGSPPPSVWIAPPSLSIAPVTQRVVLYDEDPSDPKGRQYVGSVIWRTEPIEASGTQKPDIAVRADIEIPDRKFKMTMSFRRNTDTSLPASHTAGLTFVLPQDFSGGGVGNVPGILMKSNEQARGTPLAGLAVKVIDGFFLVGFSNVDADRARNLQLLKERSWFDVPWSTPTSAAPSSRSKKACPASARSTRRSRRGSRTRHRRLAHLKSKEGRVHGLFAISANRESCSERQKTQDRVFYLPKSRLHLERRNHRQADGQAQIWNGHIRRN